MRTGYCSGCGAQFALRLDGVVRFHTRDDMSECKGSQQPEAPAPVPTVYRWQQ